MSTVAETTARVDDVLLAPANPPVHIYEIHETTGDGRDWLTAIRNFLSPYVADPDAPSIYPHDIVHAASKGALCAIRGCGKFVEYGAHMTVEGSQLLIVPTCSEHNGKGNIDKLGPLAVLKPHAVYGLVRLKPGFHFRIEDGKFYLDQTLPNYIAQ